MNDDNWWQSYQLQSLRDSANILDVPLTAVHLLAQDDAGYRLNILVRHR